ncbi:thiamine pyrophosphate-dependent enzyme [Nitratireductor sp. XY-223]|uniref:thiamine pyrophosphate-dependent enzyme n=1 Tax=Nitratireductor sp. XY-223 TaxID=2561926 RepID=UPI0010A9D2C9|nr:thiamine pyrophosphate-dependent enzyme [Nitratireductor sp. XY-223]
MASTKNVCEVLLDNLHAAGARQIFGVTGDALNPFLEAIRKDGRFEWIAVRHEENAAFAACSQAALTGGIGVCAGTVGPGALHLINGLYNAKRELAGVVAITGQISHKQRSTEYHQEVNLTKMFDEVCHFQAVIDSAEQTSRLVQIAIQRAIIDKEIVRIELPIDVSENPVPTPRSKHHLVTLPSTTVPPRSEIERAAKVINKGKKVAFFCGAGCREAKDQILELAKRINAPIVHTLKGKDIFDYDDGPVVGMTGLIGNPGGYHALRDCDVMMMLGTDFPYDWFIKDGPEIIQIDRRVGNVGRRAALTVGLVGTVKETVELLAPLVKDKTDGSYLDLQRKRSGKWLAAMDEQGDLSNDSEPLHPQLVAKAISEHADDDAIFATDTGLCVVWIARQMRLRGGRRLVGSFNHSSLGSGFPTGLGAIATHPDRQVWTLCGDGGFGMAMQDFVTAVRYGWPLKVVVFNNSELGFVKMEMEVAGYAYNRAATHLDNPDFVAYAKSCGGDGARVEKAADILPAIEAASKSDKPFLIDAIVSAGELVMPPHVDVKQAWGFGISKITEGILGLKGDHAQWDNWEEEIKAAR